MFEEPGRPHCWARLKCRIVAKTRLNMSLQQSLWWPNQTILVQYIITMFTDNKMKRSKTRRGKHKRVSLMFWIVLLPLAPRTCAWIQDVRQRLKNFGEHFWKKCQKLGFEWRSRAFQHTQKIIVLKQPAMCSDLNLSEKPVRKENCEQAVLKSGRIKAQEDQAKLAIQ